MMSSRTGAQSVPETSDLDGGDPRERKKISPGLRAFAQTFTLAPPCLKAALAWDGPASTYNIATATYVHIC